MHSLEDTLIDCVNNENDIDEIFNIFAELINRLELILYVKFCMECNRNSDVCGGIHEMCIIVSIAVKLIEKGIRKQFIDTRHSTQMAIWLKVKNRKLKLLKCGRRIEEKEQAAAQLHQMKNSWPEEGLERVDFHDLDDVELLDAVYSRHENNQLSDVNEILMQLLRLYEQASPTQRDRIEKRCVEFLGRFLMHLDECQTPSEYFKKRISTGSTSTRNKESSDIIAMSTILHRCANQLENIPAKFNERLIKQILDESSNCMCKRLQFMLSQPFHAIGDWLNDAQEIVNFPRSNCLQHPHDVNTLKLLPHAIELFKSNRTMRLNLARNTNNLTGCTFERVKNENILLEALMNAAKVIDKLLKSHASGVTALNSSEMEFCFRAIHFIKIRLNLFNFTMTYKFTSVIQLIDGIQLSDELKLKLAIILARFSNEYKNEEKWEEVERFILDCGESVEEFNLNATEKTINDFKLSIGLLLKRKQTPEENKKASNVLMRFYGSLAIREVHLLYLATKKDLISHNYFETKQNVFEDIRSYIQSIELSDDDLCQNEKQLAVLSALLQLINAIDRYNLSAEGKGKFREMLQTLLNICKDLGLHYQTLNLLLIQGSFQLNELEKLKVCVKVLTIICHNLIHIVILIGTILFIYSNRIR